MTMKPDTSTVAVRLKSRTVHQTWTNTVTERHVHQRRTVTG